MHRTQLKLNTMHIKVLTYTYNFFYQNHTTIANSTLYCIVHSWLQHSTYRYPAKIFTFFNLIGTKKKNEINDQWNIRSTKYSIFLPYICIKCGQHHCMIMQGWNFLSNLQAIVKQSTSYLFCQRLDFIESMHRMLPAYVKVYPIPTSIYSKWSWTICSLLWGKTKPNANGTWFHCWLNILHNSTYHYRTEHEHSHHPGSSYTQHAINPLYFLPLLLWMAEYDK